MSLSATIKYEKKAKDVEFHDGAGGKRHLKCLPHFHQELELVIMLSGEVKVTVDSNEFLLRGGDVLLTFPNQIHSYESYTEEKYLLFIIKPELFPELTDTFKAGLPVSPVIKEVVTLPTVQAVTSILQEKCKKEQNGQPLVSAARRGALLVMLSELLPRIPLSASTSGELSSVRAVIDFCAQHFASDISLSTLESALHLNKYYISHLFNDKMKIHFNYYINSLRIYEACRMLRHTDLAIAEICDRVGFNTLRSFNRAFIEHTKLSPSEYRRQRATVEETIVRT